MNDIAAEKIMEEQPRPLSEVAYEAVLDMILQGRLRPNDLVMERRLAAELEISRTPLREAIRRLEGEKILSRQSNGALIVKPISVEDFLYALNARHLVEGECARLAAGHIPAAMLEQLYATEQKVQRGEDLEEGRTTEDIHTVIAHWSGNPVLESIVHDLRRKTAMFSLKRYPDRAGTVSLEHMRLITALKDGDGEAAKAAIQSHIDRVREFVLSKLAAL